METLRVIPMGLGLILGMLGILPALPALAGKPPSGWKQLAVISVSAFVGVIGMSAGMAHLMLDGTI